MLLTKSTSRSKRSVSNSCDSDRKPYRLPTLLDNYRAPAGEAFHVQRPTAPAKTFEMGPLLAGLASDHRLIRILRLFAYAVQLDGLLQRQRRSSAGNTIGTYGKFSGPDVKALSPIWIILGVSPPFNEMIHLCSPYHALSRDNIH